MLFAVADTSWIQWVQLNPRGSSKETELRGQTKAVMKNKRQTMERMTTWLSSEIRVNDNVVHARSRDRIPSKYLVLSFFSFFLFSFFFFFLFSSFFFSSFFFSSFFFFSFFFPPFLFY